jgi:outer membrane protein OmpA-like peptidoglycan-associated protein
MLIALRSMGDLGPAGEPGAQGPVGATGAQGPAGVMTGWTLYRDFRFDYNRSDLRDSEMKKISEIALYMKSNPSLAIGLDGSMDPQGTDPRSQDLSNHRVSAIRDALIQAGVPESRIQLGAFGDKTLVQDRRVPALLCTAY